MDQRRNSNYGGPRNYKSPSNHKESGQRSNRNPSANNIKRSGQQSQQHGRRTITGPKKQKGKKFTEKVKGSIARLAIVAALGIVILALAIPKADFSERYRVPSTYGQAREVLVLPEVADSVLQLGYVTIDGELADLDRTGYNVYSINTARDNGVDLHVREQPTTESNQIGKVRNGEYILASEEEVSGQFIKWRKVYNLKEGKEYYVCAKYLENPQTLDEFFAQNNADDSLYVLDGEETRDVRDDEGYLCTDVEGRQHYIPANVLKKYYTVLSEKELSKYYLTTLTKNSDNIDYQILVKECTKKGYENFVETVNGEYIPKSDVNWANREPVNLEAEQENITTTEIPNINEELLKEHFCSDEYNIAYSQMEGGVQGIDISCNNSTCTPEQLKHLLQTNQNIKYVVLKLGATGYGDEFSFAKSSNAKEYVKICNELNISYGFYYYSTSITEEEATKEAEHIAELYKELEVVPSLELFPFAIDVEWSESENDRRKGSSLDNLTNAQVILYKKLHEMGIITDRAMYYAPRKSSAVNGNAKLTDYTKLQEALSKMGIDLYAWIADPSRTLSKGNHRNYYNQGTMIPMVQTDLDYKQASENGNISYDVNFMDLNFAKHLGIGERNIFMEKNDWEIGDND